MTLVNEDSRIRIEADEQEARDAGFQPKPPLYAAGTPVIKWGEDNFKMARQDFDAMPGVRDAFGEAERVIASEERQDIPMPYKTMNFDSKARLNFGPLHVPFEKHAARQLSNAIAPAGSHAAAFCTKVDPELRAYNWNYFADSAAENGDERLANLRLRKNNGDPHGVYAVVSDRYTPIDADWLARRLGNALPADGKGECLYDGRRWAFSALWHAPADLEGLAAGDFFKAGIRFKTADDGTSAVKAQAVLWRNLCLNLIIIDEAIVSLGAITHKGDVSSRLQGIDAMIAKGKQAIGHFRDKWVKAEGMTILRDTDPAKAIGRLVHRGIIDVAGYDRNIVGKRILDAYNEEPGYGVTAVVNAITRAAHTNAWSNPWAAEAVEAAASVYLNGAAGNKMRYSLELEGNAEEQETVNNFLIFAGEKKPDVIVTPDFTPPSQPRPKSNLEF